MRSPEELYDTGLNAGIALYRHNPFKRYVSVYMDLCVGPSFLTSSFDCRCDCGEELETFIWEFHEDQGFHYREIKRMARLLRNVDVFDYTQNSIGRVTIQYDPNK